MAPDRRCCARGPRCYLSEGPETGLFRVDGNCPCSRVREYANYSQPDFLPGISSGGIGTAAARLTLEGPLKKGVVITVMFWPLLELGTELKT